MKRRNDQTLGEALRHMIESLGMREKLDEQEVLSGWDRVAGAMVARHTRSISLRKGRLTVELDSAPLRHELTYMREDLRKALNERLGRPVVTEVVLK